MPKRRTYRGRSKHKPPRKNYLPGAYKNEANLRSKFRDYVESCDIRFLGEKIKPLFARIEPGRGATPGLPDTVFGTHKGLCFVELKCEPFLDFSQILNMNIELPIVKLNASQVEVLPALRRFHNNVYVLTGEKGGDRLALVDINALLKFKYDVYRISEATEKGHGLRRIRLRGQTRQPFQISTDFHEFTTELGLSIPKEKSLDETDISGIPHINPKQARISQSAVS